MDFSMSAGQFPFRSNEKSQSALVPKNKSCFFSLFRFKTRSHSRIGMTTYL